MRPMVPLEESYLRDENTTREKKKRKDVKFICDSRGQTFLSHPVHRDAWRRRAGMRGSCCYHPSRGVCMISASLNCSFKLSSRRFRIKVPRSVSRCLVFLSVSVSARDVESATLIGRSNRTWIHTYVSLTTSSSRVRREAFRDCRRTTIRQAAKHLSLASISPDFQSFRCDEKREYDRQAVPVSEG